MGITLTEASKLVGITKNGISKAIAKGKISGQKNIHGQWEVEPVELFRVYPKVDTVSCRKTDTVSVGESNKTNELEVEIAVLREQINGLREQMREKDAASGAVIKALEEHISTLKVLTDQRQRPEEKNFWQRLFG